MHSARRAVAEVSAARRAGLQARRQQARVSRSIEVVIRSGAAQEIFLHSYKGGRPRPHAFVR
jgi:hypothetical protein